MVAISLYRGNMHQAPDAPRKWLMPRRNISLKDFRNLSQKRDKTLSSVSTSTKIPSLTTTAIVSVSNPNPNLHQEEGEGDSGGSKNKLDSDTDSDPDLTKLEQEIVDLFEGKEKEERQQQQHLPTADKEEKGPQQHLPTEGKDYSEFQIELVIVGDGTCNEQQQQPVEVVDDILTVDEITQLIVEIDSSENVAPAVVDGISQEVLVVSDQPTTNVSNTLEVDSLENVAPASVDGTSQEVLVVSDQPTINVSNTLEVDSLENVAPASVDGTSQEVLVVSDQPTINVCENVDLPSEKEKKKRELEKKLEDLKERKHNLVQMLKQILKAEEEMKRRNNVPAIRPPAPLQVETSDLGSPRQAVTRTGLDANHCGDLEGESEDHSPHNTHIRNFPRMRSTSPSGSSPFRKSSHSSLQPNTVLCPPRTSGIIASPSPSRFAPSGSAHPANIPPAPISVSGTQFIASSPSPAASGGTSVFRDSRFTSPS